MDNAFCLGGWVSGLHNHGGKPGKLRTRTFISQSPHKLTIFVETYDRHSEQCTFDNRSLSKFYINMYFILNKN